MAASFDLTMTFVHLACGGEAEPVRVTRSFMGSRAAEKYERLVGAFKFRSSADLHSALQELHPAADEVLFLASGALDVVVDEPGGERTIALEAGQAAIVPRGVWHRLVMRGPGKLVFINSRAGMQSRRKESPR